MASVEEIVELEKYAGLQYKQYKQQRRTIHLPDHLVKDNILLRLPVKSLVRFKSVCKSWHRRISSPEFATYHSRFSPKSTLSLVYSIEKDRPTKLLILKQYKLYRVHNNIDHINVKDLVEYKLYSVHNNEDHNNVKDLVEVKAPWMRKYDKFLVVGCSNGLFCLQVSIPNYKVCFMLWNPAIHQYREIDFAFSCDCKDGRCWRSYPAGFAYVSSVDDYKIVSSFYCGLCFTYDESSFYQLYYVFSLRTGVWKRLNGVNSWRKRIIPTITPVAIDKTMYFVVNQDVTLVSMKCILGLDLASEQGKELITIPLEVDNFHIFAIKGCLMLHCGDGDQGNVILRLQEHGDVYAWEKYLSFPDSFRCLSDRLPYRPATSYSCISQGGESLIRYDGQLKLIDPNQETFPQDYDHCQTIVWDYIETLISPFGSNAKTR